MTSPFLAVVSDGFVQDFTNVQTFSTAGSFQFQVPAVPEIIVQIWGAAGAGGGTDSNGTWRGGGAGGYAEGQFQVTPAETLEIQVGAGGTASPNRGGGLTGVTRTDFSVIGNIMIIAGAGGAAGGANSVITNGAGGAGSGGGSGGVGGSGQNNGGQGGSGGSSVSGGAGGAGNQTNGQAGTFIFGAAPTSPSTNGGGGGGGGDGLFGGGAGGVDSQQSGGGGGGDGSSHVDPGATNTLLTPGTAGTTNGSFDPPNTSDANYVAPAGQGGGQASAGQAGLIVIRW